MAAMLNANDASRRVSLRERLGIAPEDIAIAAPGRVHRRSGHRFAVWAVAILKIAEWPVRLVVQDTGRGARDVAAFACNTGFADQVILVGADWFLEDLLAVADVAAFLDMDSAAGGLPRPVVAAMSAGLPIVVGDIAPVRDWLANGQNALLVRPDKPREIAQALMRLIEDRALAERLGAAARSLAGDASLIH